MEWNNPFLVPSTFAHLSSKLMSCLSSGGSSKAALIKKEKKKQNRMIAPWVSRGEASSFISMVRQKLAYRFFLLLMTCSCQKSTSAYISLIYSCTTVCFNYLPLCWLFFPPQILMNSLWFFFLFRDPLMGHQPYGLQHRPGAQAVRLQTLGSFLCWCQR